jgi:hypothetical protein
MTRISFTAKMLEIILAICKQSEAMNIPLMRALNFPSVLTAVAHLNPSGLLEKSNNNLIYLDIDNNYIHHLFPLISIPSIKKPDYFAKGSAGAHITVIYPEENTIISKEDLHQKHSFIIKDFVSAEIGFKTYYVLIVESPSLLQLRRKYALPDKLCFKGYAINLHITLGVK